MSSSNRTRINGHFFSRILLTLKASMAHLNLHGDNPWKLALGFVVLLFFLVMGVAHVIYPDYFLKRSALRKGGEMQTEFNQFGIQVVGFVTALFALGILYDIGCDLFRN